MTRRALLLALLAAAGCADGWWPTIRLEIDAEQPEQIDQLLVVLTAARAGPGHELWCRSAGPLLFDDLGPEDLPIRIDAEQGELFSSRLGYRVIGRRDSSDVFFHEGNALWPEEGRLVVPVVLESACDGQACGTGRHCLSAGVCEDVPIAGIFDDEALLAEDCGLEGRDEGD